MPYTGNLVRLAQTPVDRRLSAPSPRHATNEGDPSAARGEHHVASGTGAEFAGTTYDQVIVSGGGMPLDTPAAWGGPPPGGAQEQPYGIVYGRGNPHDSTAVLSRDGGDAQWYGDTNRLVAHDGSRDRGWLRTTFGAAPMYTDAQPRAELDTDGFTSPYSDTGTGRMAKHLRGINSLPENNPPRVGYGPGGFRQGRERVRVWDSTIRAHISRLIGVQVLQPRDAYTPNASRNMINTMVISPALPREAVSPDDTAMAMTNYNSSTSSIFGGF